MTRLPNDFKEFLRLLNSRGVEYLVIGGYAVGYHGYPRATADLDLWISVSPSNVAKAVQAIREFGFDVPELSPRLFSQKESVIRMGMPPVRTKVFTGIFGVEFAECYPRRETADLDGVTVSVISLEDLRANKRASGRHQDLSDLEHLP